MVHTIKLTKAREIAPYGWVHLAVTWLFCRAAYDAASTTSAPASLTIAIRSIKCDRPVHKSVLGTSATCREAARLSFSRETQNCGRKKFIRGSAADTHHRMIA
jgi:hypothetical protein